MMKALLATALFAASTSLFAQAPQSDKPAPKGERRHFDCSQAKDPKDCEQRQAKMRAMHDKAKAACEGKQGQERRDCMRHEMCAQTKDAKACEERAEKAKAAMAKARQACEGKAQGPERRDCVREEMRRNSSK
jgi:hypothetical protein